MKPFSRSERVSGQIKKVLSDFLRKSVSDPRLASATITGVKMSSDLRIAYVYFSTHGGEDMLAATSAGFKSALGFLKRNLASKLGLRYMPQLKFVYDKSFDRGVRIEKLLKSITSENETAHSTNKTQS
jgi:ribosome-binding factor A